MTVDRLTVAVDLDDVVLDFFAKVIESMNREFGAGIRKEQCTSWDDNPVKRFDWGYYGYKSWWDWVRHRVHIWGQAQAVEGALGGVQALRRRGHEPELLTAKPEWAEPQVWRWLGGWQPAFAKVTITPSTSIKARLSDADVLVDDKYSNCADWVESDPSRMSVLFHQPWNSMISPGGNGRIRRAHDWHDVLLLVDEMEEA